MAIGFTPKFIETFPLNYLNPQQFIVIANAVAKELKWEVPFLSENGLIAFTNNGAFSWNAQITITIDEDTAVIKSESAGNDMIDFGKNKKTIEKFIDAFYKVKATISEEELAERYEVLKTDFASPEEDALTLPPPTKAQSVKNFFSIFIPTEGYYVTPILLFLNIIVFIVMVVDGANFMEPGTDILMRYGANLRIQTLEGEPWRLFTSCFIHIGIIHLLMNMYALVYIGFLLEPYIGRGRFLSAYIFTGIMGSVASISWHYLTVSAGASGAIFGMYGVFLALLTTNLIDKSVRNSLLTSIGIFVGYNLLFGLKGGIDNACHVGGLLSGIAIGYAFVPGIRNPKKSNLKYGVIVVTGIGVVLITAIAYFSIPNDINKYDTEMQSFFEQEKMALEVFNRPNPNMSKEDLLYEIKSRGIYYWKENLKILDKVDAMSLPEFVKEKDKLLRQYCELRIISYQMIYTSLEKNQVPDNPRFLKTQSQLKGLLTKIEAIQPEH